jgi:hypothetical protein
MAYNQDNDKLIKLFESSEDNNGLQFSIMSYNNGEKKLQMVRSYNKKDGTIGYGNTGRISKKEFEWIKDNIEEILSYM